MLCTLATLWCAVELEETLPRLQAQSAQRGGRAGRGGESGGDDDGEGGERGGGERRRLLPAESGLELTAQHQQRQRGQQQALKEQQKQQEEELHASDEGEGEGAEGQRLLPAGVATALPIGGGALKAAPQCQDSSSSLVGGSPPRHGRTDSGGSSSGSLGGLAVFPPGADLHARDPPPPPHQQQQQQQVKQQQEQGGGWDEEVGGARQQQQQAAQPFWRSRAVVVALLGYATIAFCYSMLDELVPIFASAPVKGARRTRGGWGGPRGGAHPATDRDPTRSAHPRAPASPRLTPPAPPCGAEGGLGYRATQLAPSLSWGATVLIFYAMLAYPAVDRRLGTLRALRLGLWLTYGAAAALPAASLAGGRMLASQLIMFGAEGLKAVAGTNVRGGRAGGRAGGEAGGVERRSGHGSARGAQPRARTHWSSHTPPPPPCARAPRPSRGV